MAWTASNGYLNYDIIVLYLSAIFWTLGYDTIYGAQDIEDDEIIDIKSTSIKFKGKIKLFVSSCYFITLVLLVLFLRNEIGINLSTLILIMFSISLFYQIKIFDKKNPVSCLEAFKINNLSGFLVFLSIILI